MRPLRLTLSAFGPFAGDQTIDFRHALDARLFGIYGPTGAGKTSILDGICFALFGESSGEERKGEQEGFGEAACHGFILGSTWKQAWGPRPPRAQSADARVG